MSHKERTRVNSERPRRGTMWGSRALKQKRMMPADEFNQGARRMKRACQWSGQRCPDANHPAHGAPEFLGLSTAAPSCRGHTCHLLPRSWSLRSRLEPVLNSSCPPRAEESGAHSSVLLQNSTSLLSQSKQHTVLGVSWTTVRSSSWAVTWHS